MYKTIGIMTLTYRDKVKFESIMNDIISELKELRANNFTFHLSNADLIDMVNSAKRKCKLNNSLDIDEILYMIEVLDINTNKLVWIKINQNENLNTNNLFVYEVLKMQYATKQEFTHFKDKYKI